MGEISESNEEDEGEREDEQSYDKIDDLNIPEVVSEDRERSPSPEIINEERGRSPSPEVIGEDLTPQIKFTNEKSIEYPPRRSFFQMFNNDNEKQNKSHDNDTSFDDRKTRVTGTSPSSFSALFESNESKNTVSIPSIPNINKQRTIEKFMKKSKPEPSKFFGEQKIRRYTQTKDSTKIQKAIHRNTVCLPANRSRLTKIFERKNMNL